MSKFPYPGYPIAPRTLRPILSVGLPVSFARLTDAFPLLADLDERIWSYVDSSVAEQLGNLVVLRACQMRSAPFWRLTYFPKLTQTLPLEDLHIEQSTYESLKNLFSTEIPDRLAGLSRVTLDRLVSEGSRFGVRQLVDLLVAVHFYIDPLAKSGPERGRLNRNDIEVMTRKPAAWRLYSHKYFPLLPQAASHEDLALSARADDCIRELISNNVISDVWGLSQLTVQQLMKRRNFGVKSLAILLDGIGPLVLEPVSDEKGSAPIEKITERPDAKPRSPLSKEQVRKILDEPPSYQSFLEKHLPQIPLSTDLSALSLRTRTYNCLSKLIAGGVLSRPSDIARLTIAQIMHTKNFGTTSLVDLLRSLDCIANCSATDWDGGVTPGAKTLEPLSSNLTWAADRLSTSRSGKRVRANDPRMHDLIKELLYLANN